MAPWTSKQIATSLDKLTLANRDEVACRLVNIVETRGQVEKLARLVSAKVSRLYAPGFHRSYDDGRRALADAFVARLLHHFANRRKSIKGVPTSQGLSGVPLLKSDLLSSAWTRPRRKGKQHHMTVAPVVAALYGAGCASVADARAVVEACLDDGEQARVEDALLILEHAARDIDAEAPEKLDEMMSTLTRQLDSHKDLSSERTQCGDRVLPCLYDRLDVLIDNRQRAWKMSPYGAAGFSGAQSSASDPAASRRGSDAPVASLDNTSDSDDAEEIMTPDGAESLISADDSGGVGSRLADEEATRRSQSPWPAYFAAKTHDDAPGETVGAAAAQSRDEVVIWASS